MDEIGDVVSLTIPSHARFLKVLRSVVESVAHLHDVDQKDVQSVLLASNEACANIIKHSYENKNDKPINLTLRVFPHRLQIELEDEGKPVKPEELHPRALDDVKPGGLGLHLIRSLMDEVIFDTEKKNGNRLILIKERRKSNVTTD